MPQQVAAVIQYLHGPVLARARGRGRQAGLLGGALVPLCLCRALESVTKALRQSLSLQAQPALSFGTHMLGTPCPAVAVLDLLNTRQNTACACSPKARLVDLLKARSLSVD